MKKQGGNAHQRAINRAEEKKNRTIGGQSVPPEAALPGEFVKSGSVGAGDILAVAGVLLTVILTFEEKTVPVFVFCLLTVVASSSWLLIRLLAGTSSSNRPLRIALVLILVGLSATVYGRHAWPHKVILASAPHVPTASEIVDELEKRRLQNPQLLAPPSIPPKSHAVPASAEPFSIAIENSGLLSDSREWPNGFWLKYKYASGDLLVPANVGLFLRFVNKESVPNHIASYTVEMQANDGRWIELTRLDTYGAEIYKAYPLPTHPTIESALTVANRADFSETGVDNQLIASRGLIKGRDMIRGWAFFEYPSDLQRVTGRELIRVTVNDVLGRKSELTYDRRSENTRDMTLPQWLKSGPGAGPIDISSLPRGHLPNDVQILPSEAK